jgi:Asp-tRNA(Asn)/Glu-tRNA(Gln) amidotransferase A subunit family amidase
MCYAALAIVTEGCCLPAGVYCPVRCCVQDLLNTAVKHDVVVVMPCMPAPPPRIDAPPEVLQSWLYRCHAFAALTALGGVPTVVVPLGQIRQGAGPAAVAVFGHSRSDTRLITVAERLTQTAQVWCDKLCRAPRA